MLPKKYRLNLIFIFGLVCIYLVIGFQDVINLRPQSIHQWAQCDRASVALNFSTDTYNLFKPRVHNISNGSGITGMEFPLINYSAGMLYRIFGFHESIYRLLSLIILTLGLFAAFKMSAQFLNDFISRITSVLLMFLSPVLVYYTPNFIPDTSGLGLILCAWYFFFRYLTKSQNSTLILMVICAALAALIKITYVISIITMILALIISIYRNNISESGNKQKYLMIAMLTVPLFLTAVWYNYAANLSAENNSTIFLLKYRMIENGAQLSEVLSSVKNMWLKQYFSKYMYMLLLFSMITIIALRKKADAVIVRITALLWLGNLLYLLFMLKQFPEHDYYIISILPAIFFQMVAFFQIVERTSFHRQFAAKILHIFFALLIIHSIWFSRHIFNDRYDKNNWMRKNLVMDNYFDLSNKIRAVGIRKNDIVISALDPSPNISLYLMNLKGITVADKTKLNSIWDTYKKRANYLILNDTTLIYELPNHEDEITLAGNINNIYFYSIKH